MNNLEEAIKQQNLKEVKEILENDPPRIDEEDEQGTAMMFFAAKTGNLALVRYVVEYSRASMNTVDSENRNILHYGAMSGDVDVCRYLVEKVGLSPVSGDFNLETPFDIAHQRKYQELEKYFEEVTGAALNDMYRNPIRTGMYPDPSIVRVGDDYYMANSSFVFFPCIPISHSKDLIHWKIIGHAVTQPEWAQLDGLEGGRGFWAPDISYYKGRFYVAVTYRLNDNTNVYRKQFVMSSDRPEGPYSKPAVIDEDGIDPSIFNDDDGKRYMLLNRGARIFELNETATKQISEAEMLYYGDYKRAPEGPHLLKKDGYYYLFEAEGGTGPGHRITVARSKELKGNYEPCPYNPIMRQMDTGAGIQRCGHGKPVQTQNGEWYMVYLCGRMIGKGYSILGRETAIDPITWTADGWPIVNHLDGPSVLQKKPDLKECIWDSSTHDDFDGTELSMDWMFPRPPEKDGYRLENGKLMIKGSEFDLNTMDARNIALRRQQDFCFQDNCRMELSAWLPGQNAGLTHFYDENTYLKFGVFARKNGERVLKIVQHVGEVDTNSQEVRIPATIECIYLKSETAYLKRTYSYSFDGKEYVEYQTLDEVTYLCDEGLRKGKRFTGAMTGMYAVAGRDENGVRRPLTVAFSHFYYDSASSVKNDK